MKRRACIHVVLAVLAGCGGRSADTSARAAAGDVIVVRGADVSGNVLDALRARVRNARIETGGGCPRILFRGARSIMSQSNPSVYVDGTLMLDTCVLQQIPTADVDYIEIYPGGNTPRTDVQRNPSGVILIVRRRG